MRLFLTGLIVLFSSVASAMDIVVLGLFNQKAIVRIDGVQRKLNLGQTSPEGVKLVAANSQVAILEIEGKQDEYRLGSHISSRFTAPTQAEARIMPVNGMYHIAGSINQQPVDFMVDTGATWIAMNVHQARALGINFRLEGKPGMVSTANGVVPIYGVMLDSVKVGEIELKNVEAGVVDGNSPTQVLLGNSFLNRVEMQRQGQVMVLKQKF